MSYFVFAVAFAAAYLGTPPVETFVVGAGIVIGAAYWKTRHPALLRLAASFTGYTLTHVLLSQLDADTLAEVSDLERAVLEFGASEKVMVTVAMLVMLIAMMVGQFGGRRETSPVNVFKKHSG